MLRIIPAHLLLTSAFAQQATPPAGPVPTISTKTASMQKMPGYFPLYWEDKTGKLWLEIDKFDVEFLYVDSMPAGMGSNDLGLDRGQIGGSRIVRFERSGPKVLLVQPNYRYRSITDDAAERRAADQSFAQSVLWGFDVQAEEGGRVLVDATQFYLRDAHHIPSTLQHMNQGTFRADLTRSAFYLPRTKNFPKNTEVEATLTFTGENPGAFVRDVTPNPQAITVREHHSFVELPGPGFHPRAFDPRSGYIVSTFTDYAASLDGRLTQRFILRHRLQKKNPAAAGSVAGPAVRCYPRPGAPAPSRLRLRPRPL